MKRQIRDLKKIFAKDTLKNFIQNTKKKKFLKFNKKENTQPSFKMGKRYEPHKRRYIDGK